MRRGNGRAALGVLILAWLCSLSLATTPAHAENEGLWLVGNKELKTLPHEVSGTGSGIQFSYDLVIEFEIQCEESKFQGALTSGSQGIGEVLFTGCALSGGGESCELATEELFANFSALVVLPGEVRFTPLEGLFLEFTIASVGEEECLLIEPGEEEESFGIGGDVCASVSSNGIGHLRLESPHCTGPTMGSPQEAHGQGLTESSETSTAGQVVTTH